MGEKQSKNKNPITWGAKDLTVKIITNKKINDATHELKEKTKKYDKKVKVKNDKNYTKIRKSERKLESQEEKHEREMLELRTEHEKEMNKQREIIKIAATDLAARELSQEMCNSDELIREHPELIEQLMKGIEDEDPKALDRITENMEDAADSKIRQNLKQVEDTRTIMYDTIDKSIENDPKLDELNEQTKKLKKEAEKFHKTPMSKWRRAVSYIKKLLLDQLRKQHPNMFYGSKLITGVWGFGGATTKVIAYSASVTSDPMVQSILTKLLYGASYVGYFYYWPWFLGSWAILTAGNYLHDMYVGNYRTQYLQELKLQRLCNKDQNTIQEQRFTIVS